MATLYARAAKPLKLMATGAEKTSQDLPVEPVITETVSGYVNKFMQYVPSEVISVYLLGKAMYPNGANEVGVWAVICWVLAFAVRWFGTQGEGKIPNVVLTTLAFPLWVMAIGGTILGFTFGAQMSTLIVMAYSVLATAIYNNK